jgi:ATP adenylyltransferase/5',5'''-P-1,P-4-tetraphosphate phosphorylase II
MKLETLTNATVVDDAIRFVSSDKSKDRQKPSDNSNEDKESDKPDYDEDKDQLDGEQEEQTSEMTVNQVF